MENDIDNDVNEFAPEAYITIEHDKEGFKIKLSNKFYGIPTTGRISDDRECKRISINDEVEIKVTSLIFNGHRIDVFGSIPHTGSEQAADSIESLSILNRYIPIKLNNIICPKCGLDHIMSPTIKEIKQASDGDLLFKFSAKCRNCDKRLSFFQKLSEILKAIGVEIELPGVKIKINDNSDKE